MTTVRAKFKCEKVVINEGTSKEYTFRAVYSNDPGSVNNSFWKATPSGTCVLWIDNPSAQIYEPGKEYYLDFTPVSEA